MTASKSSAQLAVISDQRSGRPIPITQPIPIEQLRTASWNARKTFDQGGLEELAESLRQQGVIVDLIVRPIDQDLYEIVAGERRYRAAQIAGLIELPCKIEELDDDQAREIALIDNLQREDVPAMEEAAAFEALLGSLGSIANVAARVGKEQAYVAKRLKLCTLTEAGRAALREGLITVDHALVLARLGMDEQDSALKWCLDRYAGSKTPVEKVIAERIAHRKEEAKESKEKDDYRWRQTWEPATVQALRDHVASETGILLSRAPWSLEATDLIPDAAPCNACPQNTKANAPLFGDLLIGEPTCTDGGCFKEKTQAWVRLQSRVAEGAGVPVRVSWKATSTAPHMEKDGSRPSLTQTFKAGQWIEAKPKSCEYVLRAVTVDWSDANDRGYRGDNRKLRKPGEIVSVCVASKCKAHPKAYEKRSAGGNGCQDEAERKAKEAKRKAAAAEETKIRVSVAAKMLEGIKTIPGEAIRVLARDAMPDWGVELAAAKALLPGFKKILETGKTDCVEFARAVALVSIYDLAALEFQEPAAGRNTFLSSMRRLGMKDPASAWSKPTPAPAKKPAKKAAKSGSPATGPSRRGGKKAGRK
jgi:ParB family chromosome partitioning protein